MAKQVLKWAIPVDDTDHPVGAGPVVLTDCRNAGVVMIWTEEDEEARPQLRSARVYGTGHPVPAGDVHLGSARHEPTGLVWHVYGSTSV